MCKLRGKIKGFTLIELILALAIGTIFLAIFFLFFLTHQKAINSTVIKSQLQMDMQQVTDYFTKSAMETSHITSLNDITLIGDKNLGNVYISQKLGATEAGGIIFSVENSDSVQQYTYKYRVDGKYLWYTPPGLAEKVICNDISYVKITPIDGKPFEVCSGIVLEIQLIGADGKITYDTTNNMYFRNKN
ncbi:MAG: prepilin-type N-terminal cleavage/methylation domain-containing protein [Clostridium sp.]